MDNNEVSLKIGDKVKIVSEFCGNIECIGKIGIIIDIHKVGGGYVMDVEFEKTFRNGHTGEWHRGKTGKTWTYYSEHVEKVNGFIVELV